MPASFQPILLAERLLQEGRRGEAVATLERATLQGDAAAAFQLAAWCLIGQIIPRNLSRAREALKMARAAGHADAALLEIALTANGSGAPADWPSALRLLADAAQTDPVASAHEQLIDTMELDEQGRPRSLPDPELLAGDRILRWPGFATPAECAHLAAAASDLLAPAVVFDPHTGRQIAHPIRTNHEAVIGPMRESMVVRAINHRLAAFSRTAIGQGEALTVLRYTPGQQFRMHHDTINGTRNQRAATMLIYLNDGYGGGETSFPEYGLTIAPRAGDALLFRNLEGGRPDPRARHAGLPVTHGAKWIATRWIRERPFDPWTGPEVA